MLLHLSLSCSRRPGDEGELSHVHSLVDRFRACLPVQTSPEPPFAPARDEAARGHRDLPGEDSDNVDATLVGSAAAFPARQTSSVR